MAVLKVSRRTAFLGAIAGFAAASGLRPRPALAQGIDGRPSLSGFTVLTVTGAIGNPNRGPFAAATDKFFAAQNIAFTKAFAFSREDLLGLPQKSVTAKTGAETVTYQGPGLLDVLGVTGVLAKAKSVSLRGLDGYFTDLSIQDVNAQDWVLALVADTTPLGLGDKGPCYLVRDLADGEKTEQEDAKWVHSIFYIEVKA